MEQLVSIVTELYKLSYS